MHMHVTCGCGHVVHADSEDELVRKTQEHMKTVHGKDMSKAEVLKMAQEGKH